MKRQIRLIPRIFLLFLFTALIAAAAPVFAETIVDIPLPEDIYPENSDEFTIFRNTESGAAKGDTEVYARMVLPEFSSLLLEMEMPLSEQATISWDLLGSDRQTVLLHCADLVMTNGYTRLWLFRGTLPPGTYYLRLYDFGRGCSDEFKDGHKSHIITKYYRSRDSLKEDDLAGSNNTRETAAVLTGFQEGYLSIQGSDPQDWYTFDAGEAGAELKIYHTLFDDDFQYASTKHILYRRDGSAYTEIGNGGINTSYELEAGTYYLCMNCGYFAGDSDAPPLRGGSYGMRLTQKEDQTEAPQTEAPQTQTLQTQAPQTQVPQTDTPAVHSTLKKGTVKKVSGQSYTITKAASSGTRGTVSFKKASNKKSVTVPASVKIGGKTYLVTVVETKAFTGSRIRTVTIGANVKALRKNAFSKSRAVRVILKTRKLTRSNVRNCLKGSTVKTIQVKLGTKKLNGTYIKKYKAWFTKAHAGRKAAVK